MVTTKFTCEDVTAREEVGNVSEVFMTSCDISTLLHLLCCVLAYEFHVHLQMSSFLPSPSSSNQISLKLQSYERYFQLYMFKDTTIIFESPAYFLVLQILMNGATNLQVMKDKTLSHSFTPTLPIEQNIRFCRFHLLTIFCKHPGSLSPLRLLSSVSYHLSSG